MKFKNLSENIYIHNIWQTSFLKSLYPLSSAVPRNRPTLKHESVFKQFVLLLFLMNEWMNIGRLNECKLESCPRFSVTAVIKCCSSREQWSRMTTSSTLGPRETSAPWKPALRSPIGRRDSFPALSFRSRKSPSITTIIRQLKPKSTLPKPSVGALYFCTMVENEKKTQTK